MLKKLTPTLLILSILIVSQLYPKFNKAKNTNLHSSHVNNEVKNESKSSSQTIDEDFSLYNNNKLIPSKANQENINNISDYSTQNINKYTSAPKPEQYNQNISNPEIIKTSEVNVNNVNTIVQKKDISISSYLSSLQCVNYQLKVGETLTDIARKYESKCNLNTTIKFITSINKISDKNNLDSGIYLSIPEDTLKNGIMYTVISGDTWNKISNLYYSQYDTYSIMNFLVYINDLPNNDLPLGEAIFLPSI